jgi:hypothetical protein
VYLYRFLLILNLLIWGYLGIKHGGIWTATAMCWSVTSGLELGEFLRHG